MKNFIKFFGIIGIFLFFLCITGTFFILTEIQQVVITQFGRPIGAPITNAGLHFKFPFLHKLHYFDKRLLAWDGDPNQIPTRDKKYIWVDTTARWKIKDALKFMQSVGSERGAQARLDDIVNSATRDIITSNVLVETIRDSNRILDQIKKEDSNVTLLAEEALENVKLGRNKLEQEILNRAQVLVPQYGIDLIDVRIKRLNYVENVRKKVYERMISERKRAAESYRSEGRGKSAEIRGRKEKELKLITSEAYREAQRIRGEADAEAISIYASSYSDDPEFYSFIKTLETYESTIDDTTTIVLSTNSDYYKYIKQFDK